MASRRTPRSVKLAAGAGILAVALATSACSERSGTADAGGFADACGPSSRYCPETYTQCCSRTVGVADRCCADDLVVCIDMLDHGVEVPVSCSEACRYPVEYPGEREAFVLDRCGPSSASPASAACLCVDPATGRHARGDVGCVLQFPRCE
jgi:hypothetical protein